MSDTLPNWDSYIQVASLSDIGMRRSNNQDNLIVSHASTFEQWQRKGHLFVVADGMGAHAAGELASKLAVDHIPHIYERMNDLPAPERLQKSVVSANSEIHRKGQLNEDFHNMGTTCSTLALLPQGAVVAHIGDSRIYRLRGNRIEQLTFDHSLVWEMRATGQLSAEAEAEGKIPRNVITRSLGPYPECKVDLEGPFPIQVGDTFLLCSDGLTGLVSDEEIGAIISHLAPKEAVRVLVDLANLRGGSDNSTVIIAKVIHQKMATRAGATDVANLAAPSLKSVNPFAWVTLAASLFLTIVAVIATWKESGFLWIVPALVAVAALIWILIQIFGGSAGAATSRGKRYGRGPYVRVEIADGIKVTNSFASVIAQLREGAESREWNIAWDKVDALINKAEEAKSKGDFAAAIRGYGLGVSSLMDQLRNQGGDSTIDYS